MPPPVATQARLVLDDCREARAQLMEGIQGATWRVRWVTMVVLLRTVLHVLDKVDAPTDAALSEASRKAWNAVKATRPEPTILWGFIEEDRNLLLKTYEHRSGQSVTVYMGVGAETYYHMNSPSPFVGKDPRDVADQAIEWLAQYLDKVEAAAGRPPSPPA
jgi:hypothetical protein